MTEVKNKKKLSEIKSELDAIRKKLNSVDTSGRNNFEKPKISTKEFRKSLSDYINKISSKRTFKT